METPNLGWLYYKDYYSYLWNNKEDLQAPKGYYARKRRQLTNAYSGHIAAPAPGPHSLSFSVAAPGLVLGTGYQHETGTDPADKEEEGEFKLGFYFDYATGLPQIPGSSLKGVLRSVFPFHKGELDKERFTAPRLEYLQDLIQQVAGLSTSPSSDQVQKLEQEIFEGFDARPQAAEKKKHEPDTVPHLGIYQRDVFYGGFVQPQAQPNQPLLGTDFLTPHKEPTKGPNVLQFLKVNPGVVLTFSFKLHNSQVPGLTDLTAALKLKLFEHILQDVGLGAKTNVGFGQLQKPQQAARPKVSFTESVPVSMKAQEVYPGKIIGIEADRAQVRFEVGGQEATISKRYDAVRRADKKKVQALEELQEGAAVTVKIQKDYNHVVDERLNCQVRLQ